MLALPEKQAHHRVKKSYIQHLSMALVNICKPKRLEATVLIFNDMYVINIFFILI